MLRGARRSPAARARRSRDRICGTHDRHHEYELCLAVEDVDPRQARRFAEATGTLAKTDRLDAAMLARMGAMLQLQARPPRSETVLEPKELRLAREALVMDRTAAKNRGKVVALPLL